MTGPILHADWKRYFETGDVANFEPGEREAADAWKAKRDAVLDATRPAYWFERAKIRREWAALALLDARHSERKGFSKLAESAEQESEKEEALARDYDAIGWGLAPC